MRNVDTNAVITVKIKFPILSAGIFLKIFIKVIFLLNNLIFCREAPASLFPRVNPRGIVLFFGAKKRTKRNIHPLQGLPLYGEDATLKIAETDDFQINTKVDLTIKGQI